MTSRISRRSFLKHIGYAGAALSVLPGLARGQGAAPSRKLRVASIGVGGMGASDMGSLGGAPLQFVAVCDVNDLNLAAALKKAPDAKGYTDWRKLLAEMDKDIDAVTVSTPTTCTRPSPCRRSAAASTSIARSPWRTASMKPGS